MIGVSKVFDRARVYFLENEPPAFRESNFGLAQTFGCCTSDGKWLLEDRGVTRFNESEGHHTPFARDARKAAGFVGDVFLFVGFSMLGL